MDKIYEAKVVNYGKRLMFEFMVPEPAAFHLWAMSNAGASAKLAMEKPIDPRSEAAASTVLRLSLTDATKLDKDNYSIFAGYYGASVTPPPPEIQTIEVAYGAENIDMSKPFGHIKNDLKIPEGYQPTSARVAAGMARDDGSWIGVGIGSAGFFISCLPNDPSNKKTPQTQDLTMANEIGTLPISICGHVDMYVMNICVTCTVTESYLATWKLKTFQAIMEAYENKNAQYQQAVAEANAQSGVTIQGTNPAINRQLEQQELKKGCLKWLLNSANLGSTATSYAVSQPDDWSNGAAHLPLMDLGNRTLEHAYIVKFLEQAFEWNVMTYSFYPYFWGNESRWRKLYQLNDTDPIFLNFLQAGMARVLIPVQPGFEKQMLHFLRSGQIWNSSEVPALNSLLYQSITKDLAEITTVEGPTWEIRVPTALTILQTGSGALDVNGLPCGCEPGEAFGGSTGAVLTASKS